MSDNARGWQWTNLSAEEPSTKKKDFLLTSMRIVTEHGFDRVTLWNRGACAGTPTLREGDGMPFTQRLIDQKDFWQGAVWEPADLVTA